MAERRILINFCGAARKPSVQGLIEMRVLGHQINVTQTSMDHIELKILKWKIENYQ